MLEFVIKIIGTATWRAVYSRYSGNSKTGKQTTAATKGATSALREQNRPKVLAERDVEGFRV